MFHRNIIASHTSREHTLHISCHLNVSGQRESDLMYQSHIIMEWVKKVCELDMPVAEVHYLLEYVLVLYSKYIKRFLNV